MEFSPSHTPVSFSNPAGQMQMKLRCVFIHVPPVLHGLDVWHSSISTNRPYHSNLYLCMSKFDFWIPRHTTILLKKFQNKWKLSIANLYMKRKLHLVYAAFTMGYPINDNNHSSCTSKYRHVNAGVCTLEVYRKVCNFAVYVLLHWLAFVHIGQSPPMCSSIMKLCK